MGSGICRVGCEAHCRRYATRAIAFVGLTLSAVARAAPAAIDLDWRAPLGCPDRVAVRRYVDEMLGRNEAASSLAARGSVQRVAADRWTADLALRTASGTEATRSFEGPSCEAVSRAAALIMALAIHPSDPPAPPVDAPPERDAGPPPRPIAGRFARPEIAPAGLIDVGSTPTLTWGGALAGGWSPHPKVRLEAHAAYFTKARGTVADQAQLGADMSLSALGLRGCYPALDAVVSLAPCIGGGVDWLRASGFGARIPRNVSALTTTLELSGILLWNFNEFAAIRLGVHAVVPLTRPEFVVDGAGSVYRRTSLSARAAIGVELHF